MNPRDDIVLCPRPIQPTYSNILEIVEYIEIHKLMGISKFYIYKSEVSQELNKVLEFYSDAKTIEVLDWNLDRGRWHIR